MLPGWAGLGFWGWHARTIKDRLACFVCRGGLPGRRIAGARAPVSMAAAMWLLPALGAAVKVMSW